MKCNEDCFNCIKSVEKCKGGSYKKAYKHEKAKKNTYGKIIMLDGNRKIGIKNNNYYER